MSPDPTAAPDPTARDPKRRAQSLWRYVGDDRPDFAIPPGVGQESVWDYPRPPRLEPDGREVIICVGDVEVARTRRALRVLETASPPTIYVPFADARPHLLIESPQLGSSHCEWKGGALYWSIETDGHRDEGVGWSYPTAASPYEALRECFSVYPGRVTCLVDGERVRPQQGGFYGGWVTNEIVGPWKGGAGTGGW
ncbi:MAG: DUF427 domain-containing protein [Gemmatimonadaceae bacterium]|nr:DUF427 domain-containing protein [Gemmatimonadaceae bacterium]